MRPDANGDMVEDGNRCLALDKVDGKWRIVWGCYPDGYPDLGEWKPIVECSAEIRVEATEHYPALRLAVIESAEEFIKEVDAAYVTLAEAIEKGPRPVEAQ